MIRRSIASRPQLDSERIEKENAETDATEKTGLLQTVEQSLGVGRKELEDEKEKHYQETDALKKKLEEEQ